MLPGDAPKGSRARPAVRACHDSGVYTRADRPSSRSIGLIGQVNGCVRQTGAKLSRDQVTDVVKYLDDAFYRFP